MADPNSTAPVKVGPTALNGFNEMYFSVSSFDIVVTGGQGCHNFKIQSLF